MKKQMLLILISLMGITNLYAGDYATDMQKGLEKLKNINTLQDAIDVNNYFERVAAINSKEWLPLYYVAYTSFVTGYRQETTALKDEWYKKGLAFVVLAEGLKKDESELYCLKGYLQLMYISNEPMTRAATQTSDAIELLEKAKALNPANPRPWYVHGQNTFYTPKFFGGGAENAKPLLEKAVGLYKTFVPADVLMPNWGMERCEKLLQKCNEE